MFITPANRITFILDYPLGEWIEDVKFRFVLNDKGGTDLRLFNGHQFRKEMKVKDLTNWVCLKNSAKGKSRCSARITTDSDNKLKFSKTLHNHSQLSED